MTDSENVETPLDTTQMKQDRSWSGEGGIRELIFGDVPEDILSPMEAVKYWFVYYC